MATDRHVLENRPFIFVNGQDFAIPFWVYGISNGSRRKVWQCLCWMQIIYSHEMMRISDMHVTKYAGKTAQWIKKNEE